MNTFIMVTVILTLMGSTLMGGIFFAFSNFIGLIKD